MHVLYVPQRGNDAKFQISEPPFGRFDGNTDLYR